MTPPPEYPVNAEVVDLRLYKPTPEDVFLVDTNVWAWLSYTKASMSPTPKAEARHYPSFLERARRNKSKLLRCGLSLSELANLIEREEFNVYAAAKAIRNGNAERKAFRRDSSERARVVAEISAAWAQVSALSDVAVLTVDHDVTEACLKRLSTSTTDAYDAFLVEAAFSSKTVCIVTHDTDMASVGGLRVFTCHSGVIYEAGKAGKLWTPPGAASVS
jgi:predicted nucleic acid-binding protein